MLTVAQLIEELQLIPPEAPIEVWFPADARGSFDTDRDVKLQVIHDHDQIPVALAVVAGRPMCSDGALEVGVDDCWFPADLELTDRTGGRRPLCANHADIMWSGDPGMVVSAVYGGPGSPGWTVAARLLAARWGDDPVIRAWTDDPARWADPLPRQPSQYGALHG